MNQEETSFLDVINELIMRQSSKDALEYYISNNNSGHKTIDARLRKGVGPSTDLVFRAITVISPLPSGLFGSSVKIQLEVRIDTMKFTDAHGFESITAQERTEYTFTTSQIKEYRKALWALFKPTGAFNTDGLEL